MATPFQQRKRLCCACLGAARHASFFSHVFEDTEIQLGFLWERNKDTNLFRVVQFERQRSGCFSIIFEMCLVFPGVGVDVRLFPVLNFRELLIASVAFALSGSID